MLPPHNNNLLRGNDNGKLQAVSYKLQVLALPVACSSFLLSSCSYDYLRQICFREWTKSAGT